MHVLFWGDSNVHGRALSKLGSVKLEGRRLWPVACQRGRTVSQSERAYVQTDVSSARVCSGWEGKLDARAMHLNRKSDRRTFGDSKTIITVLEERRGENESL